MAQSEQPTLRRIAKMAGVSHMTAARALNGDRYVSEKTRAKVQRVADKLGYTTNPAVSAVLSAVRRRQVTDYRGKIAWLHAARVPQSDSAPWQRPIYAGVRNRAEQTGFLVEDVWLNDPSLKPRQLSRVLVARGVQGIIIASNHCHLETLDWDRFAAVATDTCLPGPPVHQARPDFAFGMRETLVHLLARGYRRVGLVLSVIHDRAHRGAERATYLLESADLTVHDPIPILLLPVNAPPDTASLFAAWRARYRPDAVICYDERLLDWTRALGLAVPGELALAHLSRHAYLKEWAGINQREEQIGAAAVDLVLGQLVRGEFGVPPFQKEVLIKGEWVEGATIRPLPDASRA